MAAFPLSRALKPWFGLWFENTTFELLTQGKNTRPLVAPQAIEADPNWSEWFVAQKSDRERVGWRGNVRSFLSLHELLITYAGENMYIVGLDEVMFQCHHDENIRLTWWTTPPSTHALHNQDGHPSWRTWKCFTSVKFLDMPFMGNRATQTLDVSTPIHIDPNDPFGEIDIHACCTWCLFR